MDWSKIKELLRKERQALESSPTCEFPSESPFETESSAFLSAYLESKPQVEAALHQFATSEQWPDMTPGEKFFVAGRLAFADEVVSILNTTSDRECAIPRSLSGEMETKDMLHWLLLDIWPYGCGRFLETQRISFEQTPIQFRSGLKVASPESHRSICVA